MLCHTVGVVQVFHRTSELGIAMAPEGFVSCEDDRRNMKEAPRQVGGSRQWKKQGVFIVHGILFG